MRAEVNSGAEPAGDIKPETARGSHAAQVRFEARLAALGAGSDLAEALRSGKALADERLAAVQAFTLDVIATAGAVSDVQLRAFLDGGFTAQNALEVVLGVGTYTMSALANRMTRAPLDEQLSPFAWDG